MCRDVPWSWKGSIVNKEQSRKKRSTDSSRGQCQFRRAIYSSDYFSYFDVDTISLYGTRGLFLRSVRRRVRLGLMTLHRCESSPTRESAIRYHSKLDFRFTRRISCQLNGNVKCVRMVVSAINFDWRDNLDIESLQHVSRMTNEEKDDVYDIDNIYNHIL